MNKLCIQIVLFLLSISVCVNTETLATEPSQKKNTKSKSKKNTKPKSEQLYLTPEEIYEKNKDLLCNNPEETIQAEKLMTDAVSKLEYHATNKHGYRFYTECSPYNMTSYIKIYRDCACIEKIQYKINSPKKGKIARVYTPNLVIIQQRSKTHPWSREKYFYALAAKFEISENKTIIVMTSANINDHNSKNKKPFENTIVKSANLFKTDIDSENDIRNGKLKKTVVNIMGYVIEKKEEYLDITYVESVINIQILET
ncbi:fam-a protein [Plasmodium yoelii]|uniref:Fam-a protein n=1 Tax=Plasmodium yoelii TaxID=5861 RepID=A0A077X9W0_PLAYE|nr:fam-a protein [Plasmodium yoelii]